MSLSGMFSRSQSRAYLLAWGVTTSVQLGLMRVCMCLLSAVTAVAESSTARFPGASKAMGEIIHIPRRVVRLWAKDVRATLPHLTQAQLVFVLHQVRRARVAVCACVPVCSIHRFPPLSCASVVRWWMTPGSWIETCCWRRQITRCAQVRRRWCATLRRVRRWWRCSAVLGQATLTRLMCASQRTTARTFRKC